MKASRQNDVTRSWHSEETKFFPELFCEYCGTPISIDEEIRMFGGECGKCGHEFLHEKLREALKKQGLLCQKNKRNRKYKPPKLFI